MTTHVQYVNLILAKALDKREPLTGEEATILADEVLRLRSVIAGLSPCFAHVVEEAVELEREMGELGVDPREPSVARFNGAMKRLRAMFLDKA